MCGIFGGFSDGLLDSTKIQALAKFASRRGKDSSGLIYFSEGQVRVLRSDYPIDHTLNRSGKLKCSFLAGHSRLITNGMLENQPIERDDVYVIHNGIVLNGAELWNKIGTKPKLEIDSEIIPALASHYLSSGIPIEEIPDLLFQDFIGVVSAVLIFPRIGKLVLFSNNGSLYRGKSFENLFFSSESYSLLQIGCEGITQISGGEIYDIPLVTQTSTVELSRKRIDLIPNLSQNIEDRKLLEYGDFSLKRCSACILPETMPFIEFDSFGVCNYCLNYTKRNNPKPIADLESLLKKYQQTNRSVKCIFPFSGGRDSSFGLHFAVKELGLDPIAYTYDWGMVTDLGRRNISLMCGELGIENIIVAADIEWKRRNIRKNLLAWLKSPNIGMLSILTAGDKHFFRHIESIKEETGISLNLWSINPLEITHFKTGFLGIPPDFASKLVYQSGLRKQLNYQSQRFKEMLKSPGYFNTSLFDTISGEYFRSRKNKSDYFHLFDFLRWDENEINSTLDLYGWEKAPDTTTTWRIGDGTAAFYNYVTHRVSGFSEHDTFRSNQIREGDISREQALALAQVENLPRYENIKWYLDVLGLPFAEIMSQVNAIPRMHAGDDA
jgi:hypothetical protein